MTTPESDPEQSGQQKRRTYGSGGIRQRADGLWVATIEAGWTPQMTRRRIWIAAKSKSECRRKLRDKKRDIAKDGLPSYGVSTRETVRAWSELWLEHQVTKVAPKTFADRKSVVGNWIVPTIGPKRIDALTPGDVRAVTRAIVKAGRSTSTANNAHRILHKMLEDALAEGRSVPAITLAVDAPAAAPSTRQEIPTDQVIKLLKKAALLPDHTRWEMAFLQGMRQAECLGLTWDEVDLDQGVLSVSWQLQELTYTDGTRTQLRVPYGYEYRVVEGRLCLTRPKTKKSKRDVPLVDYMLNGLRAWKAIAPANPHNLVWPTTDGRPQVAKDDTEAWRGLQDRAKVRKSTDAEGNPVYWEGHECRHTTGTLLLRLGVDRKVIQSILGHADGSTSGIYMHADLAMAKIALQGVAQQLQLK